MHFTCPSCPGRTGGAGSPARVWIRAPRGPPRVPGARLQRERLSLRRAPGGGPVARGHPPKARGDRGREPAARPPSFKVSHGEAAASRGTRPGSRGPRCPPDPVRILRRTLDPDRFPSRTQSDSSWFPVREKMLEGGLKAHKAGAAEIGPGSEADFPRRRPEAGDSGSAGAEQFGSFYCPLIKLTDFFIGQMQYRKRSITVLRRSRRTTGKDYGS
ncbi:collagen alpha-1(I) chain-like [Pteropus medius]|uniref:collagen alpha-1(I) chain-like n=1 Tax=Pteropus vampyrus TaxID=132908 RepID=UPI00196B2624|nr:collagen alpha-1(I) chain-like [Pteropus giganteus]